jgi:uncharacterized protein (TIGR02452 family)
MKRSTRAELAKQTLEILDTGGYTSPNGNEISFADELRRCVQQTRLFQPDELKDLLSRIAPAPVDTTSAQLEVLNETTLAGISRLIAANNGPVAALNFASAKNPGGGFLGGSQAQEESLARSSGLHSSLLNAWPYYEQHRAMSSLLYSDAMILSPNCPVFRDDDGALLDEVQYVTFISSAAPNAGAIKDKQSDDFELVPEVFRRRTEYVLALAAAEGYRNIVLGAWGCGVFRNDPVMVAKTFGGLLREGGWARKFSRVTFSVFDRSPELESFRAFEESCNGV